MPNEFVPDSELHLVSNFNSMRKEYEDSYQLYDHVQHRLSLLKALYRSYISIFIDRSMHLGEAEAIMEEMERILLEILPYLNRIRNVEKLNSELEPADPKWNYFEVVPELLKYFSIIVDEKNGFYKRKCEIRELNSIDYKNRDFDEVIEEFKFQESVANSFEKQTIGKYL